MALGSWINDAREYEDEMARMDAAISAGRSAFLNNVAPTIDEVVATYAPRDGSGAKTLKQMKDVTQEMWKSGDWTSAL